MRLGEWIATRRRRDRWKRHKEIDHSIYNDNPENAAPSGFGDLRRISVLEAFAEHPKLILLGEAGGGKSS